ncbi:MAG: alpha/beta hydrolase [Candidatus Solibacter sp.]
MDPRVLIDPPPTADERLRYGDQPSQFVDVRRPAGSGQRPLVVMIHGGFWRARYDLAHAGHLCAALTAAGFPTVNIEYRRTGEPGGGWPGTFEDVKRAIEFVRGEHTIVMGHSAGGHLALWVAAEIPGLTAVIGLAAVATLHQSLSNHAARELMGGEAWEFPERYAYADPARPTAVPRVILHGDADDTVPIALSRAYEAPAKLIELPGAGHFDVIDPESECFHTVVGELVL